MILRQEIKKFITEKKKDSNCIGILLTGSHAVGLDNEFSDVDLRVLVKSKKMLKVTEEKSGIKFSYIIGNIEGFKSRIYHQFLNNSKFEARVFVIGKILYDPDGLLQDFKEKVNDIMNEEFNENNSNYTIQALKNAISVYSDYFRNEEAELYVYNYYMFLESVMRTYFKILNFEYPINTKIERILTDSAYREKNFFSKFPDQEFISLWFSSLTILPKEIMKQVEKIEQFFSKKYNWKNQSITANIENKI